MKITKIVLPLVLLFFSINSYAQVNLGIGVKGGLNLSTLTGTPEFITSTMDDKTGYNFSVFYERKVAPYVSIVPEIGYFNNGYGIEIIETTEMGETTGRTLKAKFNVNYFAFKVNAKFSPDLLIVRPYAILGPRIDFYMDSKYSSSDFNVSEFQNVLDSISKSPVFGVNAGVGVDILKVLPFQVFLEFVFNKQLSSAFKNDNVDYKHRSYEFNLGVRF